jgi:hypothetical protein
MVVAAVHVRDLQLSFEDGRFQRHSDGRLPEEQVNCKIAELIERLRGPQPETLS